jgi:superoxide dismutase, Cu-Zn family
VPVGKAFVAHRSAPTLGRAAWIIVLTLALTSCSLPYIPGVTSPPPAAGVTLRDATGRVVGSAVFLQENGSVRILLDVKGLTPGTKAVHIHDVGQCAPPSFESAGPHFNPTKAEHGSANPKGPHAGDLPNITVEATGQGHLEVTSSRVTLKSGPTSLFDANGSALVVHGGPDDMRTDPAGNSGARIACGVIILGG